VLYCCVLLFIAALAGWTLSAAQQSAPLTFSNGCVSIAANGISLHQLVTDWSRIGQVSFTGLEQLPDRPVTIHADCADERKVLDDLLDETDRLLLPRDVPLSGASAFLRIVILSRDSTSPRRKPLPNMIPEMAYPDPAPGRDWSAVEPDLDGPPPVVIQHVTPGTIAPSAQSVPEATFEYARPAQGDFAVSLPEGADRDPKSLRKLVEAIQGGAVPESLFEYTPPVRKAAPSDKKQEP
jgi:hypothetical protein